MGTVYFYDIGIECRDLVILPICITFVSCAVLMMICVTIMTLIVYYRLRHAQESSTNVRLTAGYTSETGFRIKVPFIPFTEISWIWLTPPGVKCRTVHRFGEVREVVTPLNRCEIKNIEIAVTVKDVLGMAELDFKIWRPCNVSILPAPQPIKLKSALRSFSGGEDLPDPYGNPEGDLIEMRQYVPGDSSRSIVWKIFARNRKVVVRTPERALTSTPRTCAYIVSGAGSEVSASVARFMLEHNLLGSTWGFGGDGSAGLTSNLSQAMEMLARSGNPVYPKDSENATEPACRGLVSFLSQAEAQGFQSCLIFVPEFTEKEYLESQHLLEPEAKQPSLAIRLTKRFFIWMASRNGNENFLEDGDHTAWEKYVRQAIKGTRLNITWLAGTSYSPKLQTRPQAGGSSKKQRSWWYDRAEQLPPFLRDILMKPLDSPQPPPHEVVTALNTQETPLVFAETVTGRIVTNPLKWLNSLEDQPQEVHH